MSDCNAMPCCLPGQGKVTHTQGSQPVVLDLCKVRTGGFPVKAGQVIPQHQVCNWSGTDVSLSGTDRPVIAIFPIDNTAGDAGKVQFYTEGDFNRAVIAPLLGSFSELDLSKVGIQLHDVS